MRWGILRSPLWYPIKTTNKIIMACCLLHNFIRKEMKVDPLEGGLDEYLSTHVANEIANDVEMINSLETSTEWNTLRDTTAQNIMEARGTSIAPNHEKGKVVRGRRSWSKFEEDALIHCLIDIVNDGWKAENSFKVVSNEN
ncbi:hypothetical protein ACS0TY_012008 [Phlomoides rotata]